METHYGEASTRPEEPVRYLQPQSSEEKKKRPFWNRKEKDQGDRLVRQNSWGSEFYFTDHRSTWQRTKDGTKSMAKGAAKAVLAPVAGVVLLVAGDKFLSDM